MKNSIRLITLTFVIAVFLGAGSSKVSAEGELIQLRGKIDTIDNQILELLNQRAEVVLEIGELKKKNDMGVYDPKREQQIEQKLMKMNNGPMPDSSVIEIFRTIISACRSLQTN